MKTRRQRLQALSEHELGINVRNAIGEFELLEGERLHRLAGRTPSRWSPPGSDCPPLTMRELERAIVISRRDLLESLDVSYERRCPTET